MSRLASLLGAWILMSAAPPLLGAQPEGAEPKGWLIGAGYVSAPNPFGREVDTVSAPIPLLGYVGERLTWLGPYLRYEFVKNAPVTVAGVLKTRFEGIPKDIEDGALAGIQARRPTLEAGVDVSYGKFVGSIRSDISGRHDGREFSLAFREKRFWNDTWLLEGQIAAVWQSAELTSYLYGVSVHEARPGLNAYEPGDALNYELSLLASYQVSPRWVCLGSASFRLLDEAITESPIVAQDHDVGVFVGIAYRLGHR